jgi:hypothetical protein
LRANFSACFLGYGVFFTKQFVVFSSVFSVWKFFLEILLLLMEKIAKYMKSKKLKKKGKKKPLVWTAF